MTGMNDDMIRRQVTLDTVEHMYKACEGSLEDYHDLLVAAFVDLTPSHGDGDTISRAAAIDALNEQIEQCNKALGSFDISPNDEYAIKVERASLKAYKEQLENLPPAQPETAKRIVGKSRGGMTLWYQCDMCNEPVDAQDDFCRGCGRRLTDG